MIKTVTYTLPGHWACPLINGDYSGSSNEEEAEINKFLERHKEEIGSCLGIVSTGTLNGEDIHEAWFQHGHDANRNQGASVLEFIFEDITNKS